MFSAEYRMVLPHIIFHIAMAYTYPLGFTAGGLYRFRHNSAAYGAIENIFTGIFFKNAMGKKRRHDGARNKSTAVIDKKHTVRISVKRQSHIRMQLAHLCYQVRIICLNERIGGMVRERAV